MVIGSGFVVCWGGIGAHLGVYIRFMGIWFRVLWVCVCADRVCISVHRVWFRALVGLHMLPLGVYIRSLGLVSWSVEDVFLWLVGVPMAIESLSGSWSAQVSRKAYGRGFPFRVPQGV